MIKILIADDHPIVRNGLKQIISDEKDMEVVCEASNAEEALNLLDRNEVDVVILDISMPKLSGFEALEQIKKTFPKLPVLMLSVLSEDIYSVRALKAGALGFINKETAPEELILAVRKVLTGRPFISPRFAEKLAMNVKGDKGAPLHEKLSNREFQIMCLIASGKALNEIAEILYISAKTVSSYRARIIEKMQFKNNSELTNYCIKEGLIA